MRTLLLICLTIVITGCDFHNANLERAQAELAAAEARSRQAADDMKQALEQAEQALGKHKTADAKRLVHVVWFKMKEDADRDAFVTELQKLEGIEEVNDLEVGRFQDLGDARAMSDLDMVMQMGFRSEDEYRTYQDHPIHVQLKSSVGAYISGPPVTYDYWSE